MPKIEVSSITVGQLAVNCWFLINEDTKEALVFDPGDQADKIVQYASEQGVKITAALLTHGHIDHMGGADALRNLTGAKVYALREEEDLLLDAKQNLSVYIARKVVTFAPDEFVHDGQELELAGVKLEVFHTPGHTPGGASYYCAEAGCVFSGDTLFQGSVGRTDFPGGSSAEIVRSLHKLVDTLPEDTEVFPGHDASTTIGYEKRYNPFV